MRIAYVTIEKVIRGTDKAILVVTPEGGEVWIPRSQIHEDSEVVDVGDIGELAIPEWLAYEEGLI